MPGQAANQERGTMNQEQPRSGYLLQLKLSKSLARQTAGFFIIHLILSVFASMATPLPMSDSRAAASTKNQEPRTRNQEQPLRGSQLQLKLPRSGLLKLPRSGTLNNEDIFLKAIVL